MSTGVTPTPVTAGCTGASCWEFSLDARWLVDPATGVCSVAPGGYTRIFAWVDGVGVASPRVRWDTLAPASPLSVTANFGSESEVRVSWSYPFATTTEDASVDASLDTDATADASDADAVADVVDVTDVVASDVPATPGFESVRRFWVLCDQVASGGGLDASSCASGGFSGLDVDDDASLLRFASQCGEADGGVASTATTATLARLALGRPYRFAIVAEDLAGNRSAPAFSTTCSSAQAYTDFWEAYRNGGGNAPVGCSAAPRSTSYGPIAVFAALGLVIARRRRAR